MTNKPHAAAIAAKHLYRDDYFQFTKNWKFNLVGDRTVMLFWENCSDSMQKDARIIAEAIRNAPAAPEQEKGG